MSDESDHLDDVLTEFVRSLKSDGTLPSEELFMKVIEIITKLLTRELRRRCLYSQPPTRLGLPYSHWTKTIVLEELAYDFYVESFIRRLRGLKKYVQVGDNIGPLMRKRVRVFLSDLQRRHDPIGAIVYARLRRAVELLLETGKIVPDPENKRSYLTNSDRFWLCKYDSERSSSQALADHVHEWCHHLALDLVLGGPRRISKATDILARYIAELGNHGFEGFLIGDIIDPMKNYLRRWFESVKVMVFNNHQAPLGDEHELLQWIGIIDDAIDRYEPDPQRELMSKLWSILLKSFVEEGRCPPTRDIADRLGIGRNRAARLLNRLKELIEDIFRNCKGR